MHELTWFIFRNWFSITTDKCIMEGYVLQDNSEYRNIYWSHGYSTLDEAKYECSQGKALSIRKILIIGNGIQTYQQKTILNMHFYSVGYACGGVSFESDTQKWTLKRGTSLTASTNPEDKAMLRNCYGILLQLMMINMKY